MALVFGISLALRLDYLAINIPNGSLVKNLLVALANLGILVTIPPETPIIPTRMCHINMININDPRLRGHRSGPLGFPPSQQAGKAGPGLRGYVDGGRDKWLPLPIPQRGGMQTVKSGFYHQPGQPAAATNTPLEAPGDGG